ncbi:hypothetical protein M438DRAFT_404996 [Aureobasidium pullulans EXF-150]|uniref:BZIP domain-containing protein n=1 Tax=Aureobasidium pullulans EXF-150 TaxID=1043002 RepID=A0A074XJ86_AURPU|nr:uncharacterized protein M438DRAFT_404996 [Aureobasidium pullulans EXF-150]KEQ85580.1 hypothetical protein M438DRAFT_404996 [Aureobasidium pullulans EXF-150]
MQNDDRDGEPEWSHISDPQEQKRVQNRVSQRNYRRRLKDRIAELERERAQNPTSRLVREVRHSLHADGEYAQISSAQPVRAAITHQPQSIVTRQAQSIEPDQISPALPDHASRILPPLDFELEESTQYTYPSAGSTQTMSLNMDTHNESDNIAGSYFPDIAYQRPMLSASDRDFEGGIYRYGEGGGSQASEVPLGSTQPVIPTSRIPVSRQDGAERRRPTSNSFGHYALSPTTDLTESSRTQSAAATRINFPSGHDFAWSPAPRQPIVSKGESGSLPTPRDPLEKQFTHILLSIKEAGIDNFDTAVLQYYTSAFRDDSLAHWARKRSRFERLGPVLKELHERSMHWPAEELRQYQDTILEIASQVCDMNTGIDGDVCRVDTSVAQMLEDVI